MVVVVGRGAHRIRSDRKEVVFVVYSRTGSGADESSHSVDGVVRCGELVTAHRVYTPAPPAWGDRVGRNEEPLWLGTQSYQSRSLIDSRRRSFLIQLCTLSGQADFFNGYILNWLPLSASSSLRFDFTLRPGPDQSFHRLPFPNPAVPVHHGPEMQARMTPYRRSCLVIAATVRVKLAPCLMILNIMKAGSQSHI